MASILKSPTTLAILFGASAFPQCDMPANASFGRSVAQFKSYLQASLKVNPDNICDLFDSDAWPGKLEDDIEKWIGKRREICGVTDVFFFFVGHGVLDSGKFYMVSRCTSDRITSSSLSSSGLKDVLYSSAGSANFYIILDCCYSADAHRDFQDTPSKSPAVLYTSSGARTEAIAKDTEIYTRFAEALFAGLAQGEESTQDCLSFQTLAKRVEAIYHERHPDEFVRPQLGAPNAPMVNILELGVFPNPGFKEAPRTYEYFSRWIRRHGVPEGVGPLSPEQVQRRTISTRIVREQGRIRKVETVNSSGQLTANYYNPALLGGSSDGPDQECGWEFIYHENGLVAREEVRNVLGHLIYRCEYSVLDEAQSTARYFLKPSDLVRPRARSGAAFVKISRNPSGFDQRLEFFDGFEQKQPDDSGSYGKTFELDERGIEVRTVQLDRNSKPAVCREGFAIAKYTSDEFGNTTSQAYFDDAERPAFHKDGYHKARITWSPEGNLASIEFFGVHQEPVLGKDGYSSWKASYDAAGNRVQLEFFGVDGKPVVMHDGFAAWRAEYDEHGRTIAMRLLDAQGHPAYSRDGVCVTTYGYDASGTVNQYRYFEADGTTPALDRNGVARLVLTYDPDGNVIKQLHQDAQGGLTRNLEGIAGYEAKYDANGNQTLLTYLDLDGNPGPDNSGITRIRYRYDDRQQLTEQSFFDARDAAIENADGHHRIAYAHDYTSHSQSTSYFDRDDAPAFLDGYWAAVSQTDDRGNIVRFQFRDGDNQPCFHVKGYAGELRSYDAMSRQVQQQYFGMDGKPVVTSMGYAGWVATYDERGNQTRKVYWDAAGTPVTNRLIESFTYDANGNYSVTFCNAAGQAVLNADGIAERRVERDPRGNDIRTTYWGRDGKPAKRKEGFAAWEATYDRFSNRLEQRLLDENGAPASEENGTARTTYTYDGRQHKTSETYWDRQDNRLVAKPGGFAGWKATYNDRGQEIERVYFGADGETLIDTQNGYARVTSAYADHGGVVTRDWFLQKGGKVFDRIISYDAGRGRTETEPGESGGTVIRTFDRAGHEIRCEYLAADGSHDIHLEEALAFSRFEEDFDRYNRSTGKRYYDRDGNLFRSVQTRSDPAGNEVERTETQYEPATTHTTRTRFLEDGRQVETFSQDKQSKLLPDESGCGVVVERFDSLGQRVGIQYFDVAGKPTVVHGHYRVQYKYDNLGCLSEAVYSYPLDEDSLVTKTFRFGRQRSPHVQLQSFRGSGQSEQHDGYLIEYAMQPGESMYYATTVNTPDGQPLQLRMQQLCREVRADGSYVVSVCGVPASPGGQSQVPTIDMTMTRSGKLLATSLESNLTMAPMPAFPVFVGDRWQMETVMRPMNPFTNEPTKVVLNYSYTLRELFTEDGLHLARIEMQCPKTRVALGLATAWTISAAGVLFFEVEKGFLFASRVKAETMTSGTGEDLVSQVDVTVQYYDPHNQAAEPAHGA